MNFSLLKLHVRTVLVALGVILLAISLSVSMGSAKTWAEIDWLDVMGEGGIAFMTLVWIVFLLISRPPGRVTTLLTVGLCFFLFSTLLDVLDEFVHYGADVWLPVIESVPAPFGMVLVSWGLYQWHQELLTVNAQLRRREANVREHTEVDQVTQLYKAAYMRQHIVQYQQRHEASNFTLALLDIDAFDGFNRQYGYSEGDRLLREISELILMNIRQTDLACRYAGDRFILFMPNLSLKKAQQQVEQISTAVRHLAFKAQARNAAVFHTLTAAVVASTNNESVDDLLLSANQQLEQHKAKTEVSGLAPLCHA